jgi:hypothetical protein
MVARLSTRSEPWRRALEAYACSPVVTECATAEDGIWINTVFPGSSTRRFGDPAKTAMIVVDMQNDFVAAGAPMETPAARAMVAQARARKPAHHQALRPHWRRDHAHAKK